MGLKIGYMRVSTAGQSLDRQEEALTKYLSVDDVGNPYLFSDKASGKSDEREGLKLLLRTIRSGDTLYIKSIDRLGRNKKQIKECLETLTKKGVKIRILDIPTTMAEMPVENEWVIELINNLLVEVLTSIAEQERHFILQRQREGIEIAKKKGKHLGRPETKLPGNWEMCYNKWRINEMKSVEFMREVNMTKSTFYKQLKKYTEKMGNRV